MQVPRGVVIRATLRRENNFSDHEKHILASCPLAALLGLGYRDLASAGNDKTEGKLLLHATPSRVIFCHNEQAVTSFGEESEIPYNHPMEAEDSSLRGSC